MIQFPLSVSDLIHFLYPGVPHLIDRNSELIYVVEGPGIVRCAHVTELLNSSIEIPSGMSMVYVRELNSGHHYFDLRDREILNHQINLAQFLKINLVDQGSKLIKFCGTVEVVYCLANAINNSANLMTVSATRCSAHTVMVNHLELVVHFGIVAGQTHDLTDFLHVIENLHSLGITDDYSFLIDGLFIGLELIIKSPSIMADRTISVTTGEITNTSGQPFIDISAAMLSLQIKLHRYPYLSSDFSTYHRDAVVEFLELVQANFDTMDLATRTLVSDFIATTVIPMILRPRLAKSNLPLVILSKAQTPVFVALGRCGNHSIFEQALRSCQEVMSITIRE